MAVTYKCLNCFTPLSKISAEGGVVIDVCPKCAGTWYEYESLEMLLGESISDSIVFKGMLTEFSEHNCPKCRRMMYAYITKLSVGELVIDHCSICGGFWLDYKELEIIKRLQDATKASAKSNLFGFSSIVPFPAQTKNPDSVIAHYQNINYTLEVENDSISAIKYFFSIITSMPLEVHNPRKYFPFGVVATIILCALVFGYQMFLLNFMGETRIIEFYNTFGFFPNHYSFTWVISFISSIFIHGHLGHLITNMYALYIFGDNVYDLFCHEGQDKGFATFFAFFLLIGILGNVAIMFFNFFSLHKAVAPTIGASGAVAGIIAAYWRAFPKTKIYQIVFFYPFKMPIWLYVGAWMFVNYALASKHGMASPVSWAAHMGGFFAGYLLFPYFLSFPLGELHNNKKS